MTSPVQRLRPRDDPKHMNLYEEQFKTKNDFQLKFSG